MNCGIFLTESIFPKCSNIVIIYRIFKVSYVQNNEVFSPLTTDFRQSFGGDRPSLQKHCGLWEKLDHDTYLADANCEGRKKQVRLQSSLEVAYLLTSCKDTIIHVWKFEFSWPWVI